MILPGSSSISASSTRPCRAASARRVACAIAGRTGSTCRAKINESRPNSAWKRPGSPSSTGSIFEYAQPSGASSGSNPGPSPLSAASMRFTVPLAPAGPQRPGGAGGRGRVGSSAVNGIDTAVDPREPAPWNAAAPPRRPVIFGIAFATLLALLVVRNRALFTIVVDESGDPAANSIITAQAKHFALLVGNYSRLGFSHPGPGFFYVQAFGEWLFHDRFRIVPAPWNGQVLGVLVLNAALLAATMTVLAGWLRSWPATALAGAAALGFLARHGQAASVMWPPFMYVLPFLLLLVAAASVAAGRTSRPAGLALPISTSQSRGSAGARARAVPAVRAVFFCGSAGGAIYPAS